MQQVAVRHTRRRKEHLVAPAELLRGQNLRRVEARRLNGDAVLLVSRPQAALDLTAQALECRSRNDALGAAADAHKDVYAATWASCCDRCRHVAVADETNARAGASDLGNELRVAGSVEHNHLGSNAESVPRRLSTARVALPIGVLVCAP